MTFGITEMAKYLNNNTRCESVNEAPRLLLEGILAHLLVGDKIRLERIGVIEVKMIKGGIYKNPQTGESVIKKDRLGLKFRPSRSISSLLNNKKIKKRRKVLHVSPDKDTSS